MGQVPALGTPVRKRKTTVKGGGEGNPQGWRGTRKSSSDRAEDQFYLLSLALEERRDGRCPYTKAQLFGPLSTNSLYRARWSKVPCILGLA